MKRIETHRTRMSQTQEKIATYILHQPESIPFCTVGKLAKLTGVSEASVVRFATFLGYKGYSDLQQDLHRKAQKQLTTVERLQLAENVYEPAEKAIYEIFDDDIRNIQRMAETLNPKDFHQAIELIVSAKRIFIIANRSATAMGQFLEFYLDMMLENTELIRNPNGISEKLFRLDEQDLVIGLSFSRYTQSSINAVAFARDRGTPVVAITDHILSPLVPLANVALTSPSEMPSFIDSFVAPLSLINSLIVAVGREKRAQIESHLLELEHVWDRFNIFYQKQKK
nr:MurR/RpiR family transcriptional regulator [Caldalkalibacillus salinus]